MNIVRRFKQPHVWMLLKIAIALLLSFLIVSRINQGDLAAMPARLVFPWFAGALIASYAAVAFMALRYAVFLGKTVNRRELFSIVALQVAIGNLVATAAGMGSFVGMLRSRHGVRLTIGVTSLILSRAWDLILLLFALALSSWILWSQIAPLHDLVLFLIALLAVILVLFGLLLAWRAKLLGPMLRLGIWLRLGRFQLWGKITDVLSDLVTGELGTQGGSAIALARYSVLSFAASFGFLYCVLQFLAVPLDLWIVIFMFSVLQLVAILPIQVLGGLGVLDVTYLYLFGLFHIESVTALSVVIGIRVTFYLINFLLLLYLPGESVITHFQENK
ncbi:MAG: lysylphosphatidylglycerol synthase transmembrane domain-containing protein [Anaerolineae bacterium]